MVVAINWLLQPFDTTITIRQFDFAWRAIVALTVCYSAFIAEIFRAGIESVQRGQLEAARSLGLSPLEMLPPRHLPTGPAHHPAAAGQ